MSHAALHYLISGEPPIRRGTGGNGGVPAQAYDCSNGSIFISAGTDQQFYRMCEAMAPIYNQKEVFDDPHVKERGLEVVVPHQESGTLHMVANPIRFLEHPIKDYSAPPRIGEHTREVLEELLKLDSAAIHALIAEGIVAEPAQPTGAGH